MLRKLIVGVIFFKKESSFQFAAQLIRNMEIATEL